MPQNLGNEGLRAGLDHQGDKSGNRPATGRGQNRPEMLFADERSGQGEGRRMRPTRYPANTNPMNTR